MTLDEKIGQMLMVGIDGTEVDDDFKEFAEEYKFGTVILFGKNITSAEQLVNLTNSIKSTLRQLKAYSFQIHRNYLNTSQNSSYHQILIILEYQTYEVPDRGQQ